MSYALRSCLWQAEQVGDLYNRTKEKCNSQKSSQTSQPKYIQQPPNPNFFEAASNVCRGACPNSICGMQAVMFTQVWGISGEWEIPGATVFCRCDFQVKTGIEFWWTKPKAFPAVAVKFSEMMWHCVTVLARPIFQTNSIQIR